MRASQLTQDRVCRGAIRLQFCCGGARSKHEDARSRADISKAASAASAIPNDEAGTIGDAVILISDKMTSRNSFRWTGSRSFRALKYRFGPCASKIGIGAYNAEVEMCALFATRNPLKLQEVRKVFLPIRNIHARTLKLCSRSEPAAVEIHSIFRSHAADKSP